MDDSDKKKIEIAKAFKKSIEEEMRNKFESYKAQSYNPNTKGADYEKILHSMLNDYLGGVFDINIRVHIIDGNLDYIKTLGVRGNEFDVVGLFKTSVPKMISKTESTIFVPYDSVAFIFEVKGEENKTSLEEDLVKLEKIKNLDTTISKDRFGMYQSGNYTISNRPLRLLFYYQKSIDPETEKVLLLKYYNSWDVIINYKEAFIMVNSSIPVSKGLNPKSETAKVIEIGKVGFSDLFPIIVASVPQPHIVNTYKVFRTIDSFATKDDGEQNP